MKLYIKQKVFTLRDRFTVKDEYGSARYYVDGDVRRSGKLHIHDINSNEVAFVRQKFMTFMPKFTVKVGSSQIAKVVIKFNFFKPKYYVDGLGWDIKGDSFSHDYEIISNGRVIASIHKQWMSWGDTFELDIDNATDEVVVLAVVLAIYAFSQTRDSI